MGSSTSAAQAGSAVLARDTAMDARRDRCHPREGEAARGEGQGDIQVTEDEYDDIESDVCECGDLKVDDTCETCGAQ